MRKTRVFKLIANICRLILACTFILSGFTKVIDPWGTAMKVNEYLSIYGVESLQPASMAFSIWLCGAELMMGCMLLFKVRIRLISIFAVLSMLFFTALTLLSATLIPVEDCGCFGEALKLTPWQTFFKNLALLPMAFVVWWRYRPDKIFAFNALEIVLTVTFFFLSMYLGYYCYRHLPLIDFLPYKVGVNIWEGMHAPAVEPGETETVLVYRNLETGKLHEFSLEDTRHTPAYERIRPARCRGGRHGGDTDRPRTRVYALRHLVRPPAAHLRQAVRRSHTACAERRRAHRLSHAPAAVRRRLSRFRIGRGTLL